MSSDESGKHDYKDAGFATKAIHVGQDPEQWRSGAVVPPICLSTTFKQRGPGDYAYCYGRSQNPSREVLEKCLASLEHADYALCYASGMAACINVGHLLHAGDHVICMDDVYGGVNRYFRTVLCNFGIVIDFVDLTSLDELRAHLRPETRLVWIETPTNPTLKVVDIAAVCAIVKQHNADVITVVDNTFVSPFFQSPLKLGATIAMHSMTKYINGHSDVISGCLMLNDRPLYDRLKYLQNTLGCIPSPFDCYLVNRGIKTLSIRMRQHMENGLAVAQFLEANPRVQRVLYPGLASHPGHAVAMRQQSGFSGMISFYIKGDLEASRRFLKACRLAMLAESLGGYETLVEHPVLMTHMSVPREIREKLGYGDNFIRMSVGLENKEDIIADLDQALKVAVPNI